MATWTKTDLETRLRDNPTLTVERVGGLELEGLRKLARKPTPKAGRPSGLALRFERLWKTVEGHPLRPEYRFDPSRKFRSDYFHPSSRTLIELEGGLWQKGGHSTGRGIQRDIEKYNLATLLGYRVIRLHQGLLRLDCLRKLAAWLVVASASPARCAPPSDTIPTVPRAGGEHKLLPSPSCPMPQTLPYPLFGPKPPVPTCP